LARKSNSKTQLIRLLLTLVTVTVLSACATGARGPTAPQDREVEARVREPARQDSEGIQVFPLQNPAVKELLADAGNAEQAARMAKSAASDAGAFLADRAVQLHGGIGFTWESDVHLFFKRSMHDQALYGDGVHQRRKLADELIGSVAS